MVNSTDLDIELQAIEKQIKENNIVIFMKGTRLAPQCGFSAAVIHMLEELGAKFQDINVLASDSLRQAIKEYSDWPTIPQLYIKEEFIGGYDIVKKQFEDGSLINMLQEKELI